MTLEQKIGRLIKKDGPISFARFMEIALFDPEEGYYTKGKAAEDYYTSPAAHPAFGALLALQLEQMWEIMERPRKFTVVEMGAGRGLLAEDIMDFAERWSPVFYEALRYIAIERGARETVNSRQQTVGSRHSSKFSFVRSSHIPLRGVTGCFLSNELLDSFPVHRLVKRESVIREILVGLEDGKFAEVTGSLSSGRLEKYLDEHGIELVEGQSVEVNLEAIEWICDVSASLKSGYVVTIDYGYEASRLYSQRFYQGTLLCYYRHNYTDNPYIRVGQQDITSHVNFTALMREGEKLRLETVGFTSQAQFLGNLGMDVFLAALAKLRLPQQEHYANQTALRNLASPEGVGNFTVLIQSKGVKAVPLYGLTPSNELRGNLMEKHAPVPLLKPDRLSLLQASYPHYYFQP